MQISAAVCVGCSSTASSRRRARGARCRRCIAAVKPPARLLLRTEGSGFFSLFATEHGHNEKEAELDLHRQF